MLAAANNPGLITINSLNLRERNITDSSMLSGVPQLRSGLTSPCPVCCRLPFTGMEMKEEALVVGAGPELAGGGTTAAGGGKGMVRLAGNQPALRVL